MSRIELENLLSDISDARYMAEDVRQFLKQKDTERAAALAEDLIEKLTDLQKILKSAKKSNPND
jgi:hypothetical protein